MLGNGTGYSSICCSISAHAHSPANCLLEFLRHSSQEAACRISCMLRTRAQTLPVYWQDQRHVCACAVVDPDVIYDIPEHVWDLDTSSSPMREWRTWTLRKKNIHCRKPFFACRECFPYTAPLMLSHLESYLMHAQTHRRELCQVYRTWQIPVACLQN